MTETAPTLSRITVSRDNDKAAPGSYDEQLDQAIANGKEDEAIAIVNTGHAGLYKKTAAVLERAIVFNMPALAHTLIHDGARALQEPPMTMVGLGEPICCLCTAAKKSDVRTMRSLISHGLLEHYVAHSYYYRHTHNFVCYAMAACNAQLEMAELLLHDGPAVPSRVHGTMLMLALRRGHAGIVRLLLREGAHRPTFDDVDTALREGHYDTLLDLLRAGGTEMRMEGGPDERMELVETTFLVADAVCTGKCSPEVLRRLLKCTAMAWMVGTPTELRKYCDYRVLSTVENSPQWWDVVGALTAHGWTCAVSTRSGRTRASVAHAAGCAEDAAHDDDYAESVYDPKGDNKPSDISSGDDDEQEGSGDKSDSGVSPKRPRRA